MKICEVLLDCQNAHVSSEDTTLWADLVDSWLVVLYWCNKSLCSLFVFFSDQLKTLKATKKLFLYVSQLL